MIVVASLYRLLMLDGKYSPEHMKLKRTNCKVTKDYVDFINSTSMDNGKVYVIDEKATEENNRQRIEKSETRIEAEKIAKDAGLETLSKVINEVVEKNVKTRGRKPKQ